jgi:hypothetical protein
MFSLNCTLLDVTLYRFSRKGEEPPVHCTGRSRFRQRGQHRCGITDDLYPQLIIRLIIFIHHGMCVFILTMIFLSCLFFCWSTCFSFKGCKSGVRSELACADLMAAVRPFPCFPLRLQLSLHNCTLYSIGLHDCILFIQSDLSYGILGLNRKQNYHDPYVFCMTNLVIQYW